MCDGKNTLQEMASAACAQGLTTLGFTGHSYTQRDREYCMSPSRTAQYKATIAKLKTEYFIKNLTLCGEHDDRYIRFCTDFAAYLIAVDARKHQIKKDQVRIVLFKCF